jgi:hypothetical protein
LRTEHWLTMRVSNMAPFSNSPEDWQRLDWEILRDSGIALYWRHEYLTEDVQWLTAHNYDTYQFDCEQWNSESAMYSDMERVLHFSDWGLGWAENFDALDDCLEDLPIREDGGAAFVFHRFNVYASGCGSALMPSGQSKAEVLLDVLARTCRFFLLNGKRFVTLVQTENPDYRVGRVGAVAPSWHRREWLDSKRRPELRKETS